MVEPVTWHPSADRATIEALVAEQDRRLVPLTTWLADAGVEAVGSSRTLQVLTPAYSRITYPLELMLRDSGARWVVREGRERFRDGLTGVRMYWTGTRFAPDLDAPVPDVGALRPGSGDLELQVTTVHPPSSSLQLGGVAEVAMRKLSDSDPTGWGISEPVAHPWSPRELTAFCRDRAPASSQVLVLGNGVLGQIHVERTKSGVQERVRLTGPPAGVVDAAVIESLAEALAGSARSVLVAASPGRLDGTRSAEVTMPALPYAVLVGRSVVAQRGVAHAEQVPISRYRILDGACWCHLDTGPERPYELLTAVCSHFGIIP
ncbi:MAG: hypothetical protein GEU83_00895 [Pseudonocardiaceae bacterium]|nr:hypothetical protein [Pseudonocardiaceae bacterium]